jgi:nucleoporin p58/p45
VNATSVIQSDALFTRDIKAKADQAVQDTIVATRIVDGFRNPQQNGAYLKNSGIRILLRCVLYAF